MLSATEYCKLAPDNGVCSDQRVLRWYYDAGADRCSRFLFSGCGGNKNNFLSHEQCVMTCQGKACKCIASVNCSKFCRWCQRFYESYPCLSEFAPFVPIWLCMDTYIIVYDRYVQSYKHLHESPSPWFFSTPLLMSTQ